MAPAGFLEAHDEVAELGAGEPGRNHLSQYPATLPAFAAAAGDDQNETVPAQLRVPEERHQSRKGAFLAHAVQVDARIDVGKAA